MKSTNKPPPLTKDEIENDPDMGLGSFDIPEPMLGLPDAKDPLYVEKPIFKYEPMQSNQMRKNLRDDHNENKIIKKKFKPEPTT